MPSILLKSSQRCHQSSSNHAAPFFQCCNRASFWCICHDFTSHHSRCQKVGIIGPLAIPDHGLLGMLFAWHLTLFGIYIQFCHLIFCHPLRMGVSMFAKEGRQVEIILFLPSGMGPLCTAFSLEQHCIVLLGGHCMIYAYFWYNLFWGVNEHVGCGGCSP